MCTGPSEWIPFDKQIYICLQVQKLSGKLDVRSQLRPLWAIFKSYYLAHLMFSQKQKMFGVYVGAHDRGVVPKLEQ